MRAVRNAPVKSVLLLAMALAYATGLVLHALHLEGRPFDLPELGHWLRDGTLALVPALVVALAGLSLVGRARASTTPRTAAVAWATLVGTAYAAALVPGALLHGLIDGHAVSLEHAVHDAAAGLPVSVAVAHAGIVIRACLAAGARRPDLGCMAAAWIAPDARVRRAVQRWSAVTLAATLIAGMLPAVGSLPGSSGLVPVAAAAEVPAAAPCTASTVDRDYAVVAVNVVLPFNRWGDVDRHGQVYVLEGDRDSLTHWMFPLDHPDLRPGFTSRRLRPRPLVLRANEGECVRVQFTNDLEVEAPIPSDDPLRQAARPNPPLSGENEGLPTGDQFASIHIHGASYDVRTSDGGKVGFNEDTTVSTVEDRDEITYFWRAPAREGLYFFHDHATVAGSEADAGSNSHGLWGALAVEPAGSRWYDPISGAPLYSPSNAAPAGSIPGLVPGGPADTTTVSGDLYLDAVIDPPGTAASFREMIQISQDEVPGDHLQNCDLKVVAGLIPSRSACTDPEPAFDADGNLVAGFEFGIGLGFNYGVEPLLVRQEPINRCPDCVGEETWLSSWPYGDPGLVKLASGLGPWYPTWHPLYPGNDGAQNHQSTADPEDCGLEANDPLLGNSCYTSNVVHAYQFDATKLRFLHAGPKETHVFHMHAHQWLSDPRDTGSVPEVDGSDWPARTGIDTQLPEATTIDSQTFGPGEGFTADLLFGAGSRPGTIGDSIFHCHLYPHFAEGFWSLFRTHDVVEDGTGLTPDGIRVRNLARLPDDPTPTERPPTADRPGYPRFLPGEFGWRAPQPIGGVWEPNGSQDLPETVLVREDLDPAVRMVAGQALDARYLNQLQVVKLTGATGGAYTLEYRGQTTRSIAWDESPETALELLDTIGDVVVTAVTDGWSIRFAEPVRNVVPLSADGSGLTGGSAAVDPDHAAADHPFRRLLDTLDAEDAATGGSTRGTGQASPADRGHAVVPGAPVVDPCPEGARQVTYNVSVIQTDIVYNEAGWHDPQARYYILTEDLPAVLSGQKAAEPFFFRANPGDCLNFNLTNQLPNYVGNDDFLELIQTNMVGQHIHLVKFDVTASDGASNGWNYQQAAFSEDQMLFNQSLRDGSPLRATSSAVGRTGAFAHYPADAIADCEPDTLDGLHIDETFAGGVLTSNGNGCRIADPEWFNPTWACGDVCPTGQTIRERWYVDYDLRTVFTHDHHFPAEDQNRGLFAALVVEPTGMDVRDPFSGGFFQPINDPVHGRVCGTALPAADDAARAAQGLAAATGCEGKADGIHLDVIGPAASDDFREYSLAVADFVSLYRDCQPGGAPCSTLIPGQEPLAPPPEPEIYPDDDPGVFAVNYRNAPLLLRNTRNGVRVDPAYWFSSRVHGDPRTTLYQAYAGDPVRYRVIQGSQEEQHVVQVHGMRWHQEPSDPGSPLVNAATIGISEAFNFVLPQMTCGVGEDCFGDYLYSTTSTDDLWLGAWGIMRVFGKGVQHLLPLPDNIPQAASGNTNFAQSGTPPPKANKPGNPCASTAPVKAFDVVAVDTRITYNAAGDHDPYGLVYAVVLPGETPADAAARVRAGNPRPMVLHVTEGDCVEVTLHNRIDPAGAFATEHGPVGAAQAGRGFDPPLVLESPGGTPAGLRVSLHAALLRYDVRGSDGATIGFNRDQTVGPGESIKYRWWADDVTPGELGAINLTDYGDVRGHRHHGLFAGLVVHPAGATVHDPLTGVSIEAGALMARADALEAEVDAAAALAAGDAVARAAALERRDRRMEDAVQLASGEQVAVRIPGRADYRNWTLFFQDGLNLWDAAGRNVPDQLDHPPTPQEPAGVLPDAEDRGEKGFNYRNASFHHRLDQPPGAAHDALAGTLHRDVFSSLVHGDPATPVFRAYRGDAVRVRVLQGSDKPRQHSLVVSGHAWYRQPFDDPATTEIVGTTGGMSVGRALDIHLLAGGAVGSVGDHRYNCGVSSHHQSGGLWGIARVYAPPALPASGAFVPSALAAVDNPFTAGYAPLMPLELVEILASAWDDADADGTRDAGEVPLGRSSNGDPVIQGVDFQLHEITGGQPGAPIGAPVMTAANGMTSFSVVPGAYTVKAVVPPPLNPSDPPDWLVTGPGWFGADASTQANVLTGQVGLVQLADVSVGVYLDLNGDDLLSAGESLQAGWTVTLRNGSEQRSAVTSDVGGGTIVARFDGLDPGTYQASVTPKSGLKSDVAFPVAIEVTENASLGGPAAEIQYGFYAPSGVNVHVFNDADDDGIQDPGESNKAGWDVTLTPTGSGTPMTVKTGSDGVATFGPTPENPERIPPDAGTYAVSLAYPNADWSLGTYRYERLLNGSPDTFDSASALKTAGVGAPGCSGCDSILVVASDPSSSPPSVRSHNVSLGVRNPKVTVVAEPFNDFGNDGVRNGGDRKLVGWKAELMQGGTSKAESTTGNDGRAVFYLDPGTPGGTSNSYTVKFTQPSDAEIPWAPTPATGSTTTGSGVSGTVSVIAGESATATRGFIRLGTLEVTVFHDLDANARNDDYDPALAARTIRLLSRNGRTVLATKVTGSAGSVAFPVSTSTEYQVEVVVPAGWIATAPIGGNGSPATRVKLTTTASATESTAGPDFGMRALNDTTPPPDPVFTPPGGTYTTAPLVTITSEDGASIWYTTDGSDPAPGSGTLVASPATVQVPATVTIRAVAVDGAGNQSAVTSATYTITAGGGGGDETRSVAPTSWSVQKGVLIGGGPADLASDNGLSNGFGYLRMGSAQRGKDQVVWAEGTATAQAGTISAFTVGYEGLSTAGGVSRALLLWDFIAGKWVAIDSRNEATGAGAVLSIVVANPARYVSGVREIRFRVETQQKNGHELWIDQLVATVTTTGP